MLRKDLMGALQLEKTALRMAIEVGLPLLRVLCRLALAGILADCGDQRKCIAHLQTLRDIVRGIDNRFLEFTCLIGSRRSRSSTGASVRVQRACAAASSSSAVRLRSFLLVAGRAPSRGC